MAYRIKAINAFRPRIDQGNTVQKPELVRSISHSTGIAEGTLAHRIKELRDQIIEYCRAGRAVKMEGLGTWTPTIGLEGSLDIQYRPDPAIGYTLNMPDTFSGTIINREFIGKTSNDLVAKWNEDTPTTRFRSLPSPFPQSRTPRVAPRGVRLCLEKGDSTDSLSGYCRRSRSSAPSRSHCSSAGGMYRAPLPVR